MAQYIKAPSDEGAYGGSFCFKAYLFQMRERID